MWKTKFDSILNQVYYVNTSDGSVSFDLPCEVQNPKTKPRSCNLRSNRPNLLSRISSKLLMHRSKSSEELPSLCSDSEPELTQPESQPMSSAPSLYLLSVPHLALSLEDSYMLDEPLNLYQYQSDASSVSSDESIQSFYLELLANDIYYDYEHSIYYDDKSMQHTEDGYDKERERMELRLQILKELY